MTALLEAAIEAYGGMACWRGVRAIDVRFNFSGAVLVVKGFPRHLQPSCSIDVRDCRVVFQRLGGDGDDRWIFTPERVWIERRDGSVIAQRDHPRDAFADHVWETHWDGLHLTYFIGYAMWNYVSIPFLFAQPGFVTRELDGHVENDEHWRVLEVTYPDGVPAHTKTQKFYFGPDLLLRRMDYSTDVARGVAAHYCFDHRPYDGLMVSTLRRVASSSGEDAKAAGRTGFLLDFIDVAERR
jgi:hypothetical protein